MGSSVVPNSSEGLGNTKSKPKQQIAPAKRWCFTFHNGLSEISSIVPILEDKAKCYIIGEEYGNSGETPHLQGYVEFKVKLRPKELLPSSIHWEKAKGTKADNEGYIRKEGNQIWSKGFRSPPKCISEDDFYSWQKELVEKFRQPCDWDCRTIYWRYGKANIGKTQFAKWLCINLGAVVIGGKHRHMLAQVQNSNAPIYIVLLSYGDEEVSYRAIEQIKDGLFTSAFGTDNNKMEIRDAPHLLIIGNEPPNKDNKNFHPTKYDVKMIGVTYQDYIFD